MLTWRRCVSFSLASGCACVTLFTGTAYSQASDPQARSADQTGAAQGTQAPRDLAKQVSDISAENAAIREQLRQMQEQQKNLTDTIDRLQRRLDAPATAGAPSAEKAAGPPQPEFFTAGLKRPAAGGSAGRGTGCLRGAGPRCGKARKGRALPGRHRHLADAQGRSGAVPAEVQPEHPDPVPEHRTSNDTYTDHLGVVRDVHKRNDITVNRSMFILGGYIFDPRLRYSSTVVDLGRRRLDRRRRQHRLAVQQGPDAHRRLHRRSGEPIAREHLPFLHSRPIGPWRTTFSARGSRRGCGPTESSPRACTTWRSSATDSTP